MNIIRSIYRNVQFSSVEIVEAIIKQLNKDLSMSGFEPVFDESLSPNELVKDMLTWSSEVLEKNDPNLMNFLYRVDVSQNQIFSSDQSPEVNLCEKVLLREFQKVVLKRQFS